MHLEYSDGRNCTVTLREGVIVSELLQDVAAFNDVDNQVRLSGDYLVIIFRAKCARSGC